VVMTHRDHVKMTHLCHPRVLQKMSTRVIKKVIPAISWRESIYLLNLVGGHRFPTENLEDEIRNGSTLKGAMARQKKSGMTFFLKERIPA